MHAREAADLLHVRCEYALPTTRKMTHGVMTGRRGLQRGQTRAVVAHVVGAAGVGRVGRAAGAEEVAVVVAGGPVTW